MERTVLLTGQPQETSDPLSEDALLELTEVYERSWKSMKIVFKSLWPDEENVPEGMFELAEHLKVDRHRIQAWNISTYREGAREAWQWLRPASPP